MLVGHYAPAFVLKRFYHDVPLWMLMIAVQCADIIFFTLVLLNIESFSIDPEENGFLALKLNHMPWSHSLVMTLVFSLICLCGGYFFRKMRAGVALSLAILSHWFLDMLVHTPDLPLGFGAEKIGFGLWHYPIIEFVLEIVLLIAAALVVRQGHNMDRRIWTFVGFLVVLQALAAFVLPVPTEPLFVGALSQVLYISLAALAYVFCKNTKQSSAAN